MKMLSWSREHTNLENKAGSRKKEPGARSKKKYQGARGKIKKEHGAKRDEKGALKIGQKEQVPKRKGSQVNGVKCRRG